jgi:protocatechuate 3,4-dioxygenase beta subunit
VVADEAARLLERDATTIALPENATANPHLPLPNPAISPGREDRDMSATPQPLEGVPACVVTPQLTEGPYFVDERLNRSDIRDDPMDGTVKAGVPLRVGFRIWQVNGAACIPLVGAMVDVWQCDAVGVYSDVQDPGFNTVGQKFLRGSQVTDEHGYAEFVTIYPGWYEGRAVHTHFKVRTDPKSVAGYQFTSQLFYDDALTDIVHARSPYTAKGPRTLRNEDDDIFQDGGPELLLKLMQAEQGYVATIDIGIDRAIVKSRKHQLHARRRTV